MFSRFFCEGMDAYITYDGTSRFFFFQPLLWAARVASQNSSNVFQILKLRTFLETANIGRLRATLYALLIMVSIWSSSE